MSLPIKRYLALLVTYLKPQWGRTLLMGVLLLVNVGLQLLGPQMVRFFIDTVIARGPSSILALYALLLLAITLVDEGVSVATTYLSESVAWTATNQMRTDLLAHCLSLDMGFHKARTAGEMIERIDGDVDALSNFFSQFVIFLLTNVVLLVGVLIAVYFADWRAGRVLTIFSLATLLILLRLRRYAHPLWVSYRQLVATFYGFLGEHLAATEDMRGNGATGYIMQRFYQLLRPLLRSNRRTRMATSFSSATTLTIFVLGSALMMGLGAYLWSIRAITLGTVYLFWSYTDLLSQPIQQIRNQLQDLQQAEACIQRIEQLFSTQSAIQESEQSIEPPSGPLSVAFHNVTFGYNADEPVLCEVSFDIAPGRVLGILGRTGSGKTTLVRLLFRLYDAQEGEISLGGSPLKALALRGLRQRIGMVTQDVQLFNAPVRDNLTFFNRAIDDARLLQVIDTVGLSRWYQTLPSGLDSMLGADGQGLSAGEAQLLAFARVFLKDPGLVIFDEASSRLDPATERLIERAVSSILINRTGIVIAHRLATIQRADDILILEDGRIREYGPREALAADPLSRFSHLLQVGLEEVRA
ncbi:MAG TPA: ABC transporter ATP-binding protein [Ktedonobacteraceae bacterium]|nr:ABC transporter ATP-binding protein [Ktedonobacteraceae bacterium]